jgi:hypothetical protein
MSKYEPLYDHLKRQHLRRVRMSFAQIEKLIGAVLPPGARVHRAWWANEIDGAQSHAQAWMDAGYRVDAVDQEAAFVMFEAVD